MPEHEEPKTTSLRARLLRKLTGWRREPHAMVKRSEDEIQDWIAIRVAQSLEMDVDDVDLRVPFAEHGLDSRTAVGLSGELEQWLDLELSPTLVWDYPTIEAMAHFLAEESAAKFGAPDAGD